MLTSLFSATEETARTLPMSPGMFGIVAIVAFGALLAVTFAFRNIGKKH
jgi:hypothetical protein